jgi:2,3-bisphosphoglycerate-independent phosphoglycerate mutase
MKKTVLLILDGWGKGRGDETDGIHLANTPFMEGLYNSYPNSTLVTYGEAVGLPEGQMGNSEVGHLNIGAGRVVYQDLVKINNAIKDKAFFENETLLKAIKAAKEGNKKVHLIGLVSKGGVHSSQEHLYALCDLLAQNNVENSYVHAFTDGRDCDPKSGLGYISELENHLKGSNTKIASVIGRYYAMDRDQRWERIKKAHDLLTKGEGDKFSSASEAIESNYSNNITDEFIEPSVIENVQIEEGDIVICFNFRTDRCREITMALTQQNYPDQEMNVMGLHYVTMTNYDNTFKGVNIVYDKDNLEMTMGEVLSKKGLKQIRMAETEKYPHVTFFFSGGREAVFEGESRIMANSPKVATYDLQPEMSAPELTDKICAELQDGNADYICLNYANCDMVGHTGVPKAIIKACETVDSCVEKVVKLGLANDYAFVIIADHGNSDNMLNLDGSPNTAHSMNPVPCIVIDDRFTHIENGSLADVSPTILKMMGVEQPKEMTGKSLV